MSSSVGQHMLSMLEECHQLVNQLIVFYHIFIKLKDSITSDAFKVSTMDYWFGVIVQCVRIMTSIKMD